jgi:hypothetical protein
VRIEPLSDPAAHAAAVALWHETGLTRPWNDPTTDLACALDGAGLVTVLGAFDGARRVAGTRARRRDRRARGPRGRRALRRRAARQPRAVRRADLVVVCQRADAERYGRLSPGTEVIAGPAAISHRPARLRGSRPACR